MSSGHDVKIVDQSSSANIYGLFGILLQNSRLPRIFSELTLAILVSWGLDSAVDALRVPDTALASVRCLWRERSAAANLVLPALRNLRTSEVSLTL